jgi:hypothetical protein
MANMPMFDQTVFTAVNEAEEKIEKKLECDVMYFYGGIRASRISQQDSKQLKDLEEVEAALKEIGVTLEPKFDISLAARIGAVSIKR